MRELVARHERVKAVQHQLHGIVGREGFFKRAQQFELPLPHFEFPHLHKHRVTGRRRACHRLMKHRAINTQRHDVHGHGDPVALAYLTRPLGANQQRILRL